MGAWVRVKIGESVRGRAKIGESGREGLRVGEGLSLNPPPFSHAHIINPLSPTLTLTFSLNPPPFPPLTLPLFSPITFLVYLPSLSSTLTLPIFTPLTFPLYHFLPLTLPLPKHRCQDETIQGHLERCSQLSLSSKVYSLIHLYFHFKERKGIKGNC